MRAATAAAGPLEEPPGVCSGFHGLRVALGSRNANGLVASLPIGTAPAPRSRATEVASRVGVRVAHVGAPEVVGRPAESKMSFSATGTPWSGPMKRPSRASMSRCTATRAAASRSRRTHAPTVGSTASTRLRHDATRLDGDSAPARMRRAASDAPSSCMAAMGQCRASSTSATTSKRPKEGIRYTPA